MDQLSSIDNIFNDIKSKLEDTIQTQQFYDHLQEFYNIQKQDVTKKTITNEIMNDFLSNNTFYYNKTSKIYYNYVDNDYVLFNEDNMLYHVFDYITNYKEYRNSMDMSLKTMIKNRIIKGIRDNNIYETIPDTDTIQTVLNSLYPNVFSKKEYCKCFLLVIGNIILKQLNQQRTIFFTRSQMKPFLSEISKYISMYFCNSNLFNHFKFKYTQDHSDYEKLKIPCNDIHYDMLYFNRQFYVNLICVAIYYANRYKTLDGYLESVVGDIEDVYNCVYFFKQQTKKSIMDDFISKYMIKKKGEHLNEKDLIFLWKKYKVEQDLFVHMFTSYQDFVQNIIRLSGQCPSTGELHGYCSMDLPLIDAFTTFWNNHFESSEDEFYFEISEILHLFHQKQKQKIINISESTIKLILQSYYPDLEIIRNKMIHNIRCNIWDKKKEINDFISKAHIDIKENIHSLYKKYCQYQTNLKISKKYFTIYINQLKENV